MFKYENWLKEKLGMLKRKAEKPKLTRHEKRRAKNVQWRISTLFEECKDPDEIAHYESIVREYGFTKKEAIGEAPLPKFGRPQIMFVEEGVVAVVWREQNVRFLAKNLCNLYNG